jgi:hypothetical protein
MGKAKRFNAYDSDVEQQRKLVKSYGLARQSNSVSAFRSMPKSPPTATNTDNEAVIGLSNPVNTSLDLGGNQILRVTTLFLNGDVDNANFIAGNTGGLDYNVDDTDEVHDFAVDNNVKIRIGNTAINAYVGLDLGGNTIQKVTTLYLNGDGDNSHAITGTTGGLDYNVDNTNETHDFGVSGTAKLTVSNTTVSTPVDLLVTGDMTTNSDLVVFGNTTLGNATSDNISMNGTLATDIEIGGNDLDFASGGTIDFHSSVTSVSGGSASALPANPTGYFTIKHQGNTRYIPFYQ